VAQPANPSLDSLFAPPAPPRVPPVPAMIPPMAPPAMPGSVFGEGRPVEAVWPRAVAEAFQQHAAPPAPIPGAPPAVRVGSPGSELTKLKAEIAHLELLIKKLQTELQIERQYNQALELQVRALTQIE